MLTSQIQVSLIFPLSFLSAFLFLFFVLFIDSLLTFRLEAAFILSYSIIMLATDLHNSNVKTKMTREQWIKNNSGCNNGADFDINFLKKIYERIAKAPFASTAKPASQKELPNQVCCSFPNHQLSVYSLYYHFPLFLVLTLSAFIRLLSVQFPLIHITFNFLFHRHAVFSSRGILFMSLLQRSSAVQNTPQRTESKYNLPAFPLLKRGTTKPHVGK